MAGVTLMQRYGGRCIPRPLMWPLMKDLSGKSPLLCVQIHALPWEFLRHLASGPLPNMTEHHPSISGRIIWDWVDRGLKRTTAWANAASPAAMETPSRIFNS